VNTETKGKGGEVERMGKKGQRKRRREGVEGEKDSRLTPPVFFVQIMLRLIQTTFMQIMIRR
jgi:hypothetical protein